MVFSELETNTRRLEPQVFTRVAAFSVRTRGGRLCEKLFAVDRKFAWILTWHAASFLTGHEKFRADLLLLY